MTCLMKTSWTLLVSLSLRWVQLSQGRWAVVASSRGSFRRRRVEETSAIAACRVVPSSGRLVKKRTLAKERKTGPLLLVCARRRIDYSGQLVVEAGLVPRTVGRDSLLLAGTWVECGEQMVPLHRRQRRWRRWSTRFFGQEEEQRNRSQATATATMAATSMGAAPLRLDRCGRSGNRRGSNDLQESRGRQPSGEQTPPCAEASPAPPRGSRGSSCSPPPPCGSHRALEIHGKM